MSRLRNISNIYFIGIGGIGMSALARYFHQNGVLVSGYDKTETDLTRKLMEEGISIHFKDDITRLDKEAQVIIYTPAIPKDHQELNWYLDEGYEVMKRSDMLKIITEEMQAVCVAGTHGKTTVSTMIAHILRHCGKGCNAFLGGISANYDTNFWGDDNKLAVIEADEYDRSFLKLKPFIGVVTAMDADHLDIYGTEEEMIKSYLDFIASVEDTLVYKKGLQHSKEFKVGAKVSYSLQNEGADYYAKDIVMHHGTYSFRVYKGEECLGDIVLNMGGMHNVENCIASIAVCDLLAVPFEKTVGALEEFKGVKRRFEYIVKNDKGVYIDDYAHHPEELSNLIRSAASLFRGKKISVVFQPHLYSRTKDHAIGFARSLDLADEVILMDIYPARERPMEGVSSGLIMKEMHLNNKHLLSKEGVLEWVRHAKPEVLITAGAGDIDMLVEPIKKIRQ